MNQNGSRKYIPKIILSQGIDEGPFRQEGGKVNRIA
jgi:hypothetical protein